MKKIVFVLALLSTLTLTAQKKGSVSGKILDLEMNSEPLPFANVGLKNTLFKTQTNLHGNFELVDITPGNYTLVVSFLGYKTVELPIAVIESQATKIQKGLQAKTLHTSKTMVMTLRQSTGASNDHTAEKN